MPRPALAALLLAAACESSTIELRTMPSYGIGDRELIESAALEYWGLDIVWDSGVQHPIELRMRTGSFDGHVGEALDVGCRLEAWANRDERVIAHELGHLLGVRHLEQAGALMHPKIQPGDPWVTDEQIERVRASAERLHTWCWR